jgi:Holliday junction resolvasome RuvABC endonuclease subunit
MIYHHIGIDPSKRGTGIGLLTIDGEAVRKQTCRIAIEEVGIPKLLYLQCNQFADFIEPIVKDNHVIGVCIEGPSLHSTNRSDEMGQVRGAFNIFCMMNLWPMLFPVEIPPTSLKKFFTGNGNAPKDQMVEAAIAAGWDVETDDEADAAGLAELSWALNDESLSLTRKQLEAIKGIRDTSKQTGKSHTHNRIVNL